MKMTLKPSALAVLALGLIAGGAAFAKASADDVEKLGKTLTCTGGEKAGTASGVPEFTGKWLGTPPGIDYKPHVGQHPIDPYKDEKPQFVITAENLAKYADLLTDGQKAMFAKYPKTYRMPVYQGHRDFRFPDFVCASAKKNAQNAVMAADGLSVEHGVKGSLPFPIPKTGLELAFNNLLPFRTFNENTIRDNANVLSDGTIAWGRSWNRSMSLLNSPEEAGKPLVGLMAQGMNATIMFWPSASSPRSVEAPSATTSPEATLSPRLTMAR